MLPILLGIALSAWAAKTVLSGPKPIVTTTSLTLLASSQQVTVPLGGTVGILPVAGAKVLSAASNVRTNPFEIKTVGNKQIVLRANVKGTWTMLTDWIGPDGKAQRTVLQVTVV